MQTSEKTFLFTGKVLNHLKNFDESFFNYMLELTTFFLLKDIKIGQKRTYLSQWQTDTNLRIYTLMLWTRKLVSMKNDLKQILRGIDDLFNYTAFCYSPYAVQESRVPMKDALQSVFEDAPSSVEQKKSPALTAQNTFSLNSRTMRISMQI